MPNINENGRIYELAESGIWKNKPASNEEIYKRMIAIENWLIAMGFTREIAQKKAIWFFDRGLLGVAPEMQTIKQTIKKQKSDVVKKTVKTSRSIMPSKIEILPVVLIAGAFLFMTMKGKR